MVAPVVAALGTGLVLESIIAVRAWSRRAATRGALVRNARAKAALRAVEDSAQTAVSGRGDARANVARLARRLAATEVVDATKDPLTTRSGRRRRRCTQKGCAIDDVRGCYPSTDHGMKGRSYVV